MVLLLCVAQGELGKSDGKGEKKSICFILFIYLLIFNDSFVLE